LTLEDGTNKLFQNVGAELPLYTVLCLTGAHISHDDLAMQALDWLCMFQLETSGLGHSSSVLHIQILDDHTYLSAKFKEGTLSCL